MSSHKLHPYSLCPLKPAPEPSRIVSALGGAPGLPQLPSNACDEDRCAWFLTAMDEQGKRVLAACAIPVGVTNLAQITNTLAALAQLAASKLRAPGEAPTPTEVKGN